MHMYIHVCMYVHAKNQNTSDTRKQNRKKNKKKEFERKTAIKTRENAIKTEIKINNPT